MIIHGSMTVFKVIVIFFLFIKHIKKQVKTSGKMLIVDRIINVLI